MPHEICLQSLHHYNCGTLIFKWFDIDEIESVEETYSEFISWVKEETGDLIEEVMIADYSDFPDKGEYPSHDELQEVIDLMNEHDSEAVKAYIDFGGEPEHFEECYCGEYSDMAEYAQEFIESCYNLNDMGNLQHYIDYEKFGRDLEIDGYYFSDGYVFRPY